MSGGVLALVVIVLIVWYTMSRSAVQPDRGEAAALNQTSTVPVAVTTNDVAAPLLPSSPDQPALADQPVLREEVSATVTDADMPIAPDQDHDGLSDAEEKLYGTNQAKPDTDGDGYSDGQEVAGGYNPLGPGKGIKLF